MRSSNVEPASQYSPQVRVGWAQTFATSKSNTMASKFTNWMRWKDRAEFAGLEFPGVYAIAISKGDLSGTAFSWKSCIAYVGMTNSKGGLKSRLYQFDVTIKGGRGHGGAHRFRFKHPQYDSLVRDLYVAVKPFKCDVTSEKPKDLRIMGKVAKCEYDCFALYVEAHGRLPEFNDKNRSPKK